MELIEYQDDYKDLMAKMLMSFSICYQEMLKKDYDADQILKESYETIPELNEGKHHLYLGKIDNEIVGFIVLDYRGNEVCWIDDLFVIEHKRNQGYGSQMILQASELVKKQGYEAISIDVVPRNTNAIRLYRKLGFGSLSILTLRHDFDEDFRDKELELLGFKFKY